jgi:hypothetical protein
MKTTYGKIWKFTIPRLVTRAILQVWSIEKQMPKGKQNYLLHMEYHSHNIKWYIARKCVSKSIHFQVITVIYMKWNGATSTQGEMHSCRNKQDFPSHRNVLRINYHNLLVFHVCNVGQNRTYTPYMTVYIWWLLCQNYRITLYVYGSGQPYKFAVLSFSVINSINNHLLHLPVSACLHQALRTSRPQICWTICR